MLFVESLNELKTNAGKELCLHRHYSIYVWALISIISDINKKLTNRVVTIPFRMIYIDK